MEFAVCLVPLDPLMHVDRMEFAVCLAPLDPLMHVDRMEFAACSTQERISLDDVAEQLRPLGV